MKNIVEHTRSILQDFVDKSSGGNYVRASRNLGLNPASNILRKWINGERTPTLSAISPVFEKMGITLNVPNEKLVDYDLIPKVSAKAGAGASLETGDETEGLYAFRKDFMALSHISPTKSVLMDVVGDSMEPLFSAGDTLLVDKSDIEVKDGHIYVVTLGDELRVKRVHKSLSGLILRSENRKYPDIAVEGPDLETFVVHGRVRWCGKEF